MYDFRRLREITKRTRNAFQKSGDETLPYWAGGIILFLEGYASLSVEVLALRRMVPWAGSNVPVTAILLAAYLGALALGYERGGRIAATGTNIRARLGQRLAIAAALSAFWLSGAGPYVVFSSGLPNLVQVTFYSVIGIGPIGWLLAESILLVHKATERPGASRHAGNIFGLSTAGNVAGALLTALVVLGTIGTAGAVIIISAALIGAALIASTRKMQVGALAAAAVIPILNLWQETTTYVAQTAYADYRIIEIPEEDARILVINQSAASRESENRVGWPYAELIEDALCQTGGGQVLVLGAAGQTLGRGRDCGMTIEFVDIDAEQERISAEFLEETPETTLVAADARRYLLENDKRWDAIVADAYTHKSTAPEHLLTVEFFRLARSRIADGGALYLNLIVVPGDRQFRTRVDRTLRSTFADCDTRDARAEPGRWSPTGTRNANIVYRCTKSPLDGERSIYSDSVPRVSIDRKLR